MEPFVTHTGRAVPLRRTNVDTDQIIPAMYLKWISREGFGDGLFTVWREDPSFVLNQSRYDGATILVAGNDFGTGSSREHAVWALQDYGFRAVIAPRFGDIFRTNSTKAGLLPVQLPEATVAELQAAAEADPAAASVPPLAFFGVSCRGSRNFVTSSRVSGEGRDVAPTNPVTPGVLRTALHEASLRSIRTRM